MAFLISPIYQIFYQWLGYNSKYDFDNPREQSQIKITMTCKPNGWTKNLMIIIKLTYSCFPKFKFSIQFYSISRPRLFFKEHITPSLPIAIMNQNKGPNPDSVFLTWIVLHRSHSSSDIFTTDELLKEQNNKCKFTWNSMRYYFIKANGCQRWY